MLRILTKVPRFLRTLDGPMERVSYFILSYPGLCLLLLSGLNRAGNGCDKVVITGESTAVHYLWVRFFGVTNGHEHTSIRTVVAPFLLHHVDKSGQPLVCILLTGTLGPWWARWVLAPSQHCQERHREEERHREIGRKITERTEGKVLLPKSVLRVRYLWFANEYMNKRLDSLSKETPSVISLLLQLLVYFSASHTSFSHLKKKKKVRQNSSSNYYFSRNNPPSHMQILLHIFVCLFCFVLAVLGLCT